MEIAAYVLGSFSCDLKKLGKPFQVVVVTRDFFFSTSQTRTLESTKRTVGLNRVIPMFDISFRSGL